MISPRETIIAALFAQLQTLTTFTTVQREWSGVESSLALDQLDALFLVENPEKHSLMGRGMPRKIDWSFDVVLVTAQVDGTPGGAQLNPLIDKIDAMFTPKNNNAPNGLLTLGGLVYDCFIEGTILKNFSYLGGRASLAVVPLHIRVTNLS